MSLVAPEFLDIEEVSPEFGDSFLGPCCAGVGLGLFVVSSVFFLIVQDGLGDTSLEKVLPADRLDCWHCNSRQSGWVLVMGSGRLGLRGHWMRMFWKMSGAGSTKGWAVLVLVL